MEVRDTLWATLLEKDFFTYLILLTLSCRCAAKCLNVKQNVSCEQEMQPNTIGNYIFVVVLDRCGRCFAPRPKDLSTKYCSECGCVLSPAIPQTSALLDSSHVSPSLLFS